MKIVITGAAGTVGQALLPRLAAAGAEVVVADTAAGIATRAAGFDIALDLSGAGDPDRLAAHLEAARAAGVGRFVLVSSLNVLDPRRDDPATRAARAAEAALAGAGAGAGGIETAVLRIAPLRDARRPLHRLRAAFRPGLDPERLAAHVLAGAAAADLADPQDENPAYRLGKRTMDLGFAVVVLGLLGWMLGLLWLAVRAASGPPAIFGQERVGRDEVPFTCYKFRTMRPGTPQRATHEVAASAVTPVGGFLRRFKLDELPQAVNILKGEQSVVGPRPCLPVQRELIAARRARGVTKVRPGLTGLAQIEGIDMRDPERLARRDAEYLALRALPLDMWIVLATARGRGGD